MENGTMPSFFYLTLFKDFAHLRYFILIVTLLVYLAIILFNVVMLYVVFKEKSLHEPMYILISCLSVNDLYGSTGFFPRVIIDVLSDTNTISRSACFVQIFIIYTYAISEYTILTLMAYDRYVAICRPLNYHRIMTFKVITIYMGIALFYAAFSMGIIVYLAARLPLCGADISRLYCSTWGVVRLSCGVSTVINNIVGLFVTVTIVFLPAFFILYSYVRILIICQKSSKEFRGKAFQTCLPHIISFVNYSIAIFCDIVLSRLDSPKYAVAAIVFSLGFLVIPPLFNPLIYALNLLEIRKNILCLFQNPRIGK